MSVNEYIILNPPTPVTKIIIIITISVRKYSAKFLSSPFSMSCEAPRNRTICDLQERRCNMLIIKGVVIAGLLGGKRPAIRA